MAALGNLPEAKCWNIDHVLYAHQKLGFLGQHITFYLKMLISTPVARDKASFSCGSLFDSFPQAHIALLWWVRQHSKIGSKKQPSKSRMSQPATFRERWQHMYSVCTRVTTTQILCFVTYVTQSCENWSKTGRTITKKWVCSQEVFGDRIIWNRHKPWQAAPPLT